MTNEELYYLPASELLKYIQAEKERLIKEKVIKKSKPLPPITEAEKPYELPEGWEWVRLNDICDVRDGTHDSPKYVEKGFPLITSKNLINGKLDFSNVKYISEKDYLKINERSKVDNGDILLAMIGTIGNPVIVNEAEINFSIKNVALFKFFKNSVIKNNYLYYLLLFAESIMNKQSAGGVQSFVSLTFLRNYVIPLPPLYIQDQIVQKLEQLSKTKDSLLSHAESQLNYTKKMREVLLQEAIRGELVPQDENDEPASILLEKIKTEKERLIKEKVIKKQKELPQITEDEKPYGLPEGWEWVRLGNVAQFNPRNKADDELLAGFIPMTLINDGFTNKHTFETRKWGEIKSGYTHFANNDVIFAKITPCFENRKSTIIKGLPNGIGSGTTEVITLRSYGETILPGYFLALINSPDFINNGKLTYLGTAGQQRVNAEFLKNYVFALPPLAEQERIVAKLDELMANCDQLEAKAEEMKNYTTKLFEVSLKEAFMPE